ncbi:hypothetical protein VOLCADRAFT_94642 [Volvox carteri f. nagariensis]|uniref:Uncharacterized protein n=1 Tax=Volvox carteri f. nagariensis TaxID=3068 RepID=D8U5C1_VOLCA|nr:uncharacterized protein VOLCADRAFT_94642 [Volvox carteri f. nagariensis]EFJ45124.1 hypothetical protein VOLCADRAFT_94642 [Volvox carteri f. nagariensis]|eukprot:XP_002953800.1 hypothetical protein VOLCADRAFT_94642 [Volvox carteri f. nagariensis]
MTYRADATQRGAVHQDLEQHRHKPSSCGISPSSAIFPYLCQHDVLEGETGNGTSPGLLGRIKRFFLGDKLDKEKLAQLGMGAFASYGFISNVTYCTCLGIAWISFVRATGTSPLAAGQWPAFLGFYAGLWTVQNFARPLRFSLAIAMAPVFERLILWVSNTTGLSKRFAFGLYLLCFSFVTVTVTFGTIYVLGGFPPTTA